MCTDTATHLSGKATIQPCGIMTFAMESQADSRWYNRLEESESALRSSTI